MKFENLGKISRQSLTETPKQEVVEAPTAFNPGLKSDRPRILAAVEARLKTAKTVAGPERESIEETIRLANEDKILGEINEQTAKYLLFLYQNLR